LLQHIYDTIFPGGEVWDNERIPPVVGCPYWEEPNQKSVDKSGCIKNAILLSDRIFHWSVESAKASSKAMDSAVRDDSSIDWDVVFAVNPNATPCPRCGARFWREALLLECTECGTQWDTETGAALDTGGAK
jgi:hypothetical protein